LYHDEGEVVAKVSIPSTRLKKCEYYRGPELRQALEAGRLPVRQPGDSITNPHYVDPMRYVNIRGML
jgi:hypothetical protein